MSNHYSAANLRFPGDDARLDFTDIYAFQAPGDAGKTILIINANPYTAGISAMPPFLMRSDFHPDGVYRINVDNDSDAHADVAFTFSCRWTGAGSRRRGELPAALVQAPRSQRLPARRGDGGSQDRAARHLALRPGTASRLP
jgi:hypothetical protein